MGGATTMPLVTRRGQVQQRQVWCGLGQCRICSCPAFDGRGNLCENCGHHYDEHTTKSFRAGGTFAQPHHGGVDETGVNQCPQT
jgi:hypothetical protein